MDQVIKIKSSFLNLVLRADEEKLKLFLKAEIKLPDDIPLLIVNSNEEETSKIKNLLQTWLRLDSIQHVNSLQETLELLDGRRHIAIFITSEFPESEILDCINKIKIHKLNTEIFLIDSLFNKIAVKNSSLKKFKVDLNEDEQMHLLRNLHKLALSDYLNTPNKMPENMKNINNPKDLLLFQIKTELAKQINLNNCHMEVLEDLAESILVDKADTERRIMKGTAPEIGADGKLLLLVKKFTGKGEVVIDTQDKANYSNLRLFDNIQIGQKVARIYKAKNGVAGVDVFGKIIPAKSGEPLEVKFNETIKKGPSDNDHSEYENLIANCNGFLIERDGNLEIVNELKINGDLDLHFGNIDFIGKVIITGNVLPGFEVRAKDGIEVRGSVEGARLFSLAGSIDVKQYAYGGKNSQIFCSGDFKCDIAHEIKVECQGNFIAQKEAIDCEIYTQKYIIMPNGTLLGGQLYTTHGIEIKTIGNELDTKTIIYLCSKVEATREYTDLRENIEKHENALALIGAHLGPLHQHPERIKRFEGEFRIKMQALLDKKAKVIKSLEILKNKQTEMLSTSTQEAEQPVNIIKEFYPGVIIKLKELEFKTNELIKGPKTIIFQQDKNEFSINEFKTIIKEDDGRTRKT